MALRLHRAPHHAEAHPRLAVLGDEARDDGLERTLARRIAVRVILLQHEHLATVLQDESQARRRHAAAHAAVVGLDQRDHHAVGISDGHVDRVTFLQLLRRTRLHFTQRLVHRDQLAALSGVAFGNQPVDRGRVERRIGVEARAVGEGQLLGFHEQVHVFGRAEGDVGEIVAFQHVEDLQRGDALAVRRQLPHVIAAVVAADRLHPLAVMAGHVLIAQVAAIGLEVGADGAGDLAFVEGIAAALGDLLQRVGQVRVLPHLALARGMAVDRELLGEARVLGQSRHRAVPVVGDHLGDRVAFAGVADGGREVVGHRLAAETVMQGEPAIHRAGYRDRQRTGGRNLLQAPALELGQGQRLRRATRAVVPIQLPAFGVPYDREQITADAVAGGFHQTESGIGRDRGIHRRTTGLHHVQGDLGGQGLGGGGHRVRGDHLRAGGEGVAGDPVGGDGGRRQGTQDGGGEQAAGKA